MAKVRFTVQAQQDLHAIKDYIAQDNLKTAIAYIQLLRKKCETLANSPKIGRQDERYLGLRKFPVGDYLIFYRQEKKGIIVARVLHAARDIDNISR